MSSVINTGNPGAGVRSGLVLSVGTQFNRWRSKLSFCPCEGEGGFFLRCVLAGVAERGYTKLVNSVTAEVMLS
jgi:hypothetical protein